MNIPNTDLNDSEPEKADLKKETENQKSKKDKVFFY